METGLRRASKHTPWDASSSDRILATRPADLALAASHGIQERRRTVCLDFDGVLHSYRSGWCGIEVIPDPPIQWLARHGIEVDEICEHKPPALVYIDDRAICFRGDWDQVLVDVSRFRR